MMLVLNTNKTKMIRLTKAMGYNPPRNAQFIKEFRSRTWWLEWHDKIGCYSAILSTAAGKAFLGMRFNDWEGSPEKWTAETLSVEKLREYDLLKERAPKAPAAMSHRDLGNNRNCKEETITENTFEKNFVTAYLDGEARLDSIEAYIEYWHTHETNCELHEFLGMTAYEYEQWLRSGKDDVLRNILEARNGSSSLTRQIAALEERAPKAPAAAPYRVPGYERDL